MRRGNIVSGFGEDNLNLSVGFINKYADVTAAEGDEPSGNDLMSVITEIVENADNYTKEGIVERLTTYLEQSDSVEKASAMDEDNHELHLDIINKFKETVSGILESQDTIEKEDIIGLLKSTLDEVEESCNEEAEEVDAGYIASKVELVKRGFKSVGTGLYKDADHHLWKLKREGNGYNISRVAEEEDILSKKKAFLTNRVSHLITVESDNSLATFFDNLKQSGVYYNKVSGNDNSATIDVDAADIDMFNSVIKDSDVRTAKIAENGIEKSDKVFSDEAIVTGITHYTNMGHGEKDAIKYFIESNELDKKEYEARIKDVLEKY